MVEPTLAPPPELLTRRRVRPIVSVRRLWRARELVRTVAERDFRARYKQAVFGVGWAVVTPFVLMGVFTLVFKRVGDVDTQGVPYALFAIVGLIPWTFFSTSLNRGTSALLGNRALLNKVACPREVFPIGTVVVAGVDAALALPAAALLFVVNSFMPSVTAIYWVPVILVAQVAFVLGVALLASIVVVFLRDLIYVVPLALQVGLFITPVGYSLDEIDSSIRPIYSLLNPLAPVIDGYRRVVLYDQAPHLELLLLGAIGASVYLVVGFAVFKRFEGGIADVG